MTEDYNFLLKGQQQSAPQTPQQTTQQSSQESIHTNIDPRTDLKRDSSLWTLFLNNAKQINPKLYGILHGIRCAGAGLARTTDGGFKLLSGEMSVTEWEDTKKKYLSQVRDDLLLLIEICKKPMGQVEDAPEGIADLFNPPAKESVRDAWMK